MDEIQKVLVKAGRKDLAEKYYNKVAGVGYELYAKGLDRVVAQCNTISENAKNLAKEVRKNNDGINKKKKVIKFMQNFLDSLNKEMKGIVSDIDNLEGYKD